MRLFIAINLPNPVRAFLHDLMEDLRVAHDPVRWIPAGNVHLTLKFLGEVSSEVPESMERLLETVVPRFSPLELVLGSLGAFPHLRNPRIIWVGLQENKAIPELRALQRGIEEAAAVLGFRREKRAFHPHLTIGRLKSGRPRRERGSRSIRDRFRVVDLHPASFPVASVELMESLLRPEGAHYRVRTSVQLAGKGSPGS